MKRVACFCIPAHGHTNPMLPVVAELVRRGDAVRFYSFEPFRERIQAAGAQYVACDRFLSELSEAQQARLMRVSTTEMTLQAIETTRAMDDFLTAEFAEFRPDVVYADSVCFWGKLTAWKHGVPLVVSTSTFAFNQLSSGYMKYSLRELADMILGLPKVSKALKGLESCGYHVKSALRLVSSDDGQDSLVYTSRRFQPYGESFSGHYAFVGPSLFSKDPPRKQKARPLVYIALGTVINDRPDFYKKCMEALGAMDVDVILSCGSALDPASLSPQPGNFQVYPRVDQLEVLSRADVFITHCGMNSVSESLYMAAPMVLYPQTGEQRAVARRVAELGAGVMLADDSAPGIRSAVEAVLNDSGKAQAARAASEDFRSCPGTAGAAAFIEDAPHASVDPGVMPEVNKMNGLVRLGFWLAVGAAFVLLRWVAGWEQAWVVAPLAGILSTPILNAAQGRLYDRIVGKGRRKG